MFTFPLNSLIIVAFVGGMIAIKAEMKVKVFLFCDAQVKIGKLEALREQRVKVFGWVHRLRRQGEQI